MASRPTYTSPRLKKVFREVEWPGSGRGDHPLLMGRAVPRWHDPGGTVPRSCHPQRSPAPSAECGPPQEVLDVKPIHLLGAIPFLGILGGIFFVNRVTPYVLGMPFILFW